MFVHFKSALHNVSLAECVYKTDTHDIVVEYQENHVRFEIGDEDKCSELLERIIEGIDRGYRLIDLNSEVE